MSRLIKVISEAILVHCNECESTYKTTNENTYKCIECGSRDIIKDNKGYTINHTIPDGDLEEE